MFDIYSFKPQTFLCTSILIQRPLYLTKCVYSLILFLIAKGTELQIKSVAVTYYSQDIDFEQPDVVVLCHSKIVCAYRYIVFFVVFLNLPKFARFLQIEPMAICFDKKKLCQFRGQN